jgi:hypothetical protein
MHIVLDSNTHLQPHDIHTGTMVSPSPTEVAARLNSQFQSSIQFPQSLVEPFNAKVIGARPQVVKRIISSFAIPIDRLVRFHVPDPTEVLKSMRQMIHVARNSYTELELALPPPQVRSDRRRCPGALV